MYILLGGKRPVAYRTEVRVNNEISDIALYVFSTLCAVGSIVAILFLAITLRYKHVRSVSLQILTFMFLVSVTLATRLISGSWIAILYLCLSANTKTYVKQHECAH